MYFRSIQQLKSFLSVEGRTFCRRATHLSAVKHGDASSFQSYCTNMEIFSNAGCTCASFPCKTFFSHYVPKPMTVGLLVRTVTVFVTTTKKKGGEGSFKRIFSHREERIFLVWEKERELSPEQLSLFKYNSCPPDLPFPYMC